MTLIVGARCKDGVILAADRRRMARCEKGPSTVKLFRLSCGVAIAGAGDDAVLNEGRVFIERRIKELQTQTPMNTLFDIVEAAANIINDLVGVYKGNMEEPFGYVLCGLENLNTAALSSIPSLEPGFRTCLGYVLVRAVRMPEH